jgi:hypothetical protein
MGMGGDYIMNCNKSKKLFDKDTVLAILAISTGLLNFATTVILIYINISHF